MTNTVEAIKEVAKKLYAEKINDRINDTPKEVLDERMARVISECGDKSKIVEKWKANSDQNALNAIRNTLDRYGLSPEEAMEVGCNVAFSVNQKNRGELQK